MNVTFCFIRNACASRFARLHWKIAFQNLSTTNVEEIITYKKRISVPKGYSDASIRYVMQRDANCALSTIAKPFTVLGIETSCDDTGVSVVRSDGQILSNVVYSQHKVHEKFGGIVPNLALAAHRGSIDGAVHKALKQAGLASIHDVDAIAVTKGPGLEVCLRVGLRKAQALAKEANKPFVAVHHLEAHCLMARLAGERIVADNANKTEYNTADNFADDIKEDTLLHFKPKIKFPFLVLLASGGHTSILICHGLGEYTMLGGTLDDSLGEAFDKAARLLNLNTDGISGGVALEKLALQGDPKKFSFMRSPPMKGIHNCDLSYSGLKNAFRMEVEKQRSSSGTQTLSSTVTADLCASFQHVAFAHVEDRLIRALEYIGRERIAVNGLMVVGGVAANLELRRRLLRLLEKHSPNSTEKKYTAQEVLPLIFPPPALCTDNGVMAAWAGVELLSIGVSHRVEGQEVIARWPLGVPLNLKGGIL